MFVRKKVNKSGVISVQIVDKSQGKYKVKKTIGSSSDPEQVDLLVQQGKKWIEDSQGLLSLDFRGTKMQAERFLDSIQDIITCGPQLLLGKLFDQIGFDKIGSPLFKQLVLTRIEYPVSKLKTTDYWEKYHNLSIGVANVYRYMDKLYKREKEMVQQISYSHTKEILGGQIQMVFYDVTTLYFEIEQEDELRKPGYSKDGKHQHPQIVLGLLVSNGGYPLAYDIFEGNQYEGSTMLPVIDRFKEKYGFKQVTIIADAGLMNNENITELTQKGYHYILGARIKNEKEALKEKIFALDYEDGQSHVIKKDGDTSLIISYSSKRERKDKHNRERGIKRLEKQLAKGKLTKSNINNRGYNKYLTLEGEIKVKINYDKFDKDGVWDGLKGYQTNTNLSSQEVINNYNELWRIEKAFRVSKHDLKIRPIYHRTQRRIEAHICLSFTAYKVYKELERQLVSKKAGLSPEKAIDIAKTIYKINVSISPDQKIEKIMLLNEEQRYLNDLFQLV